MMVAVANAVKVAQRARYAIRTDAVERSKRRHRLLLTTTPQLKTLPKQNQVD